MSSTLRADKLWDWTYVKLRQEVTQQSWDDMRDTGTDTESLTREQFDEEFARALAENKAVEVTAYVE